MKKSESTPEGKGGSKNRNWIPEVIPGGLDDGSGVVRNKFHPKEGRSSETDHSVKYLLLEDDIEHLYFTKQFIIGETDSDHLGYVIEAISGFIFSSLEKSKSTFIVNSQGVRTHLILDRVDTTRDLGALSNMKCEKSTKDLVLELKDRFGCSSEQRIVRHCLRIASFVCKCYLNDCRFYRETKSTGNIVELKTVFAPKYVKDIFVKLEEGRRYSS